MGNKPVVLVVSDKPSVLTALEADLRRRFEADYQVLTSADGEAAVAVVADAATRGIEVALLIADQSMGELPAVEVLTRAHQVVPTAKRVLLIARGDWSAAHPVVSAMALGQVDYHLYHPWRPLERILYPAMSDFLAAWDKSQDAQEVPVRIVGAQFAGRSHELRDALTRVGVPYWFYERDTAAGQQLLAEAGADGSRLPVAVLRQKSVLIDPDLREVWQALGVSVHIDVDSCDLMVIGGGPAGLAAAVYATSEGLETLLVESAVPGGQAGTSSLIRNYLGFHRGISGDDLANRAVEQAWLFGTRFVLSQTATSLRDELSRKVVTTSDGRNVAARAVVIATGVSWRRLGVPALEALVGAGVFYGAAGAEARAMQGRHVFVVGGGNSAGQAAMHLSRYATTVTMLVRGATLRTTMSEYLVSELEQAPNVNLRFDTEVIDGEGAGRLETITVRHRGSGAAEVVSASALFLLIGAEPRTRWLQGCLARDDHGYILTGQDLLDAGHALDDWPLSRSPLLLETSIPGVFAAGDVRYRSTKRVAAAVGEGATATQLVHEYLAESDRAPRS